MDPDKKSKGVDRLAGSTTYGTLDQLIREEGHRTRVDKWMEPKNTTELKDKIERMKGRFERFGEEVIRKGQKRECYRLEKRLEWTEHKAPPVPIQVGSEILQDSLYLYGVDFMSTKDVENYFKRFSTAMEVDGEASEFKVNWINDSSCVVKLPSAEMAQKAYYQTKLSEPREDDRLPPLNLYLQDLRELEKREAEKKALNPDFDTLFDVQPETEVKPPPTDAEEEVVIDPRNDEVGIGFIDVMGYKIRVKDGDTKTNPWQNLWMRFATDKDKKHQAIKGQDSRFYKFNLI